MFKRSRNMKDLEVIYRKMVSTFSLYLGLFTCLYFSTCVDTQRFIKDVSMDKLFPPHVPMTIQGIPGGHLWPLGHQKHSDGRTLETFEMPTSHNLYIKYLKNNKPLVIRDAFKDKYYPVLERWKNDSFMKENYGNLPVLVKINRVNQKQTREIVKFKTFLQEYLHEEWHLSSTVPDEMLHDLPLPDCLKCGTFHERLQEVELWMSYGITPHLLHNHEDHVLHCNLFGRKDFILIDKKYRHNFDYEERYKNAGAGFSPMSMKRMDLNNYPEIKNTPWNHASLLDGDCIVIPAGLLHQVNAYGRSLSFTILFAPTTEFDSSDCHKKMVLKNKNGTDLTMDDANLVWTFKRNHKVLSQEEMEPHVLKKILLLLLRDNDKIFKEQFEHFYDEAVGEFSGKTPASSAFSLLVSNLNRNYLTREEVENLSTSRLMQLSRILNEARSARERKKRDEL